MPITESPLSAQRNADDPAASPAADAGWQRPTRLAAAIHALKVGAHILLRTLANLRPGAPRRLAPSNAWADAPVAAEQRSPLWRDGRDDEFALRCGKVQNLRVAVHALDGVAVAPGTILGFWAQLGRPSRRRGYAVGREIVAGCVVPTIGGGLCQLSNALASAATAAGIRLVERHRHSARIEAAAAATTVDATVAWNYVDLRLAADFPFRIEATLTADELVLRIRRPAIAETMARDVPLERPASDDRRVARGCYTCDETGCFRHRPALRPGMARSAVLVNEKSAELATWLAARADGADWFLPWVRAARVAQYWAPPADRPAWRARVVGYRRLLRNVLTRGEGAARQAARQHDAAALAAAYARRLRPDHVELTLSQDLLVPLWRSGALGSRAFDVWVGELPAGELQARLDAAAEQTPQAASLTDFRVDPAWIADEWAALAAARRRLTSHADIARVLETRGLRVERQPWQRGTTTRRGTREAAAAPTLVLAGSALARKGALEVAELARRLRARVLILGSAPSDPSLWHGVDWSHAGYAGAWLEQADLVLLPAHIEHQPRALLRALDHGLPVIATAACGIAPCPGLTLVPAGDVAALEQAARATLSMAHCRAALAPLRPASPL